MIPRDEPELRPGERATRDALRTLPRERANDEFRARLREEFTSGRIGRRRGLVLRAPWFARPATLLPVAAGLLLVLGVAVNRGPDWRLVAANGEGRVWVGDRAFALSETEALSAALRRGGRVRVEGAVTLDLAVPGVVAVALGPEAEMTLPPAPNRLWSRGMFARLESGDAYFTTGLAFRGAHLDVETPEARVNAVGTAFAVLRHAFGTCVCVMEGHVHVAHAGAPPETGVDVPEGMRRVINTDRSTETHPILDDSIHHLHEQRSRSGELLER